MLRNVRLYGFDGAAQGLFIGAYNDDVVHVALVKGGFAFTPQLYV